MKNEKSCGCIIIEDNMVLLVKHTAGHWGLPKGHVEAFETEEQTALREVKEETNLDVEIIPGYRYTVEYSPKEDIWKEVVYFIAKTKSNQIQAQETEISEIEWLDIDKAIEQIDYESSKELLRKIKTEYMRK